MMPDRGSEEKMEYYRHGLVVGVHIGFLTAAVVFTVVSLAACYG